MERTSGLTGELAELNRNEQDSINNIAIIIPNTAYGQVAMQTIKLEQSKTNIRIKKVFKYICY